MKNIVLRCNMKKMKTIVIDEIFFFEDFFQFKYCVKNKRIENEALKFDCNEIDL